ncbi:hypothetical protein HDU96_004438, partial [Phlyctochytrium bullatum]
METDLVNDIPLEAEDMVEQPPPPQTPPPSTPAEQDEPVTPPASAVQHRTSGRQAKRVVPFDPSPADIATPTVKNKRQMPKPSKPAPPPKRQKPQKENEAIDETEVVMKTGEKAWIVKPGDLAALVATAVGKKKNSIDPTVNPELALKGLATAMKLIMIDELADILRDKIRDELLPDIMTEVDTLVTRKVASFSDVAEPELESVAAFMSEEMPGVEGAEATVNQSNTISWNKKLDSELAVYVRLQTWDKVLVADEYSLSGQRKYAVMTTEQFLVASKGNASHFYE